MFAFNVCLDSNPKIIHTPPDYFCGTFIEQGVPARRGVTSRRWQWGNVIIGEKRIADRFVWWSGFGFGLGERSVSAHRRALIS